MPPLPENEIYAALGDDGFERLCSAFYRRVRTDPILSPMYPPREWEAAEGRLRDFLVYRFGGPATYIEERGHPRMRMRHAPFRITPLARNRWLALMQAAVQESQLPVEASQTLLTFFEQMSAFMINSES